MGDLVIQEKDGALRLLEGLDCDHDCWEHSRKCSPAWTTEARILNIPGQKYTIGSAKELGSLYKEEEHGMFLSFYYKDVAKIQCQIVVDKEHNFWLHSLGYSETFLNGKLIEVSPVRLKFGDIFYFCHTLSKCWDPHLTAEKARELVHKTPNGKTCAVFKFERLLSKTKIKAKNKSESRSTSLLPLTAGQLNNTHFLKTSETSPKPPHPFVGNSVILAKIFENLPPHSLFNCRLVSKSWNSVASSTLRKNLTPHIQVVVDELLEMPNKFGNHFHYYNHRLGPQLPFDSWKIDIWPLRYGQASVRDCPTRKDVWISFSRDFSSFLRLQRNSTIKILDLNIDYLPPISQLLQKCCGTLEELTIQVNLLWIGDEADIPFEGIAFPALKTLTIQFSQGEEDLRPVKNSVWLKNLLAAAACSVEVLILKNYAKLPIDFGGFKKLRRVKILGRCEYGIYELYLQDCLDQLISLPMDQLSSFNIDVYDIEVQGEVGGVLPHFLERQKNSLVRLDLIVPRTMSISLPKCMPKLKRLWVSCDMTDHEWSDIWGVKLSGEVSKPAPGFGDVFNIAVLPMVSLSREGKWVRKGSDCDSEEEISLDFGRWEQGGKDFVSYIPNVGKIWAWTR